MALHPTIGSEPPLAGEREGDGQGVVTCHQMHATVFSNLSFKMRAT